MDNVDAQTIPEMFDARVRRSPDRVAYSQFDKSVSRWEDISWRDVAQRVARWRASLEAAGLKTGDRAAILLDNCLEWVCFDQAALSLGLMVVPLYRTDSAENSAYLLSDSTPRLLLVPSEEEWRRLRPLRDRFASVGCVVSVQTPSGGSSDIIGLDDWLTDADVPAKPPVTPPLASDTLASISYTSGTTGRPKGVMLSHGNLISATRAVLKRNRGQSDDVFLAFLPMAHIFERTVEYYPAMASGARLVFARAVASLPEDLISVRPTIMIGVPRIYERSWNAIQETAFGRFLLDRALTLGHRPIHSLVERLQLWLIDRLLCRRISERFGGRLRLAVCGSAPLSPELALGLRAVGVPIVEGYGLAEAAGPISGDEVSSYAPGSAGRLLDGVEARIAKDGELLVRAPSVMQGYWNRPEDTARTIDGNGWLHTGDLAAVREDRLVILGRVHDVIVTATAEKLSPHDLEMRIVSDPLFEQAVVVGNARPFLVALVVLEPAQWQAFAAANNLDPIDPNDARAEGLLIDKIGPLIRDFPSYAQIRRLFASLEPWTLEDGLVTATLKTKRKSVEKKHADVIASLYEGHVSPQAAAASPAPEQRCA
ncbi:MAG: long-chain fatty acid--CoA ligase [Hyphomicrobiales bacterium]|nr:long-chain fatty acid--CoA ligase [Hyphomicrobiales bacterium]